MAYDSEDRELLLKISDKLDNLSQNMHELDKKLAIETLVIKNELEEIKKLDAVQNEILDEHHKRSDQLERDNKLREESLKLEILKFRVDIDKRLKKLESPVQWIKGSWKVLLGIGMGAAAIYAVLQLLGKAP